MKYILSERFCQDPLEAYFGKQRYKGGQNDNPSAKEYLDNAVVTLRVQASHALDPVRENSSRKRKNTTEERSILDGDALPKRKRCAKRKLSFFNTLSRYHIHNVNEVLFFYNGYLYCIQICEKIIPTGVKELI